MSGARNTRIFDLSTSTLRELNSTLQQEGAEGRGKFITRPDAIHWRSG